MVEQRDQVQGCKTDRQTDSTYSRNSVSIMVEQRDQVQGCKTDRQIDRQTDTQTNRLLTLGTL